MAQDRSLAEVIAGANPSDVDRAAVHMPLALEDEVHVVSLVALPEHECPRRERDLVEQLEERAEILRTDVRQEAVLREEHDVLGAVSVGEREDGGVGLARLHGYR